MKERPILFSGEMVRAILDDRKTQTRRVVKILRTDVHPQVGATIVTLPGGKQAWLNSQSDHPYHISKFCPYGIPGDRLWVREAWREMPSYDKDGKATTRIDYKADGEPSYDSWPWRPSIHMHRQDSRITLEVAGIRVERVQNISEEDAKSEGVDTFYASYRKKFEFLWDTINAQRGFRWDANPWVWVIEFRRVVNA